MSEFKTNKISPRKGTTQTIGDSGDTLSIASGVTVTNAGTISTAGISGGTINNTSGTISGLQGVIDWDTTPKTTGFTAVSQKGYFCNTTSAAFTVTLPASPVAGDVIALKDYANTFDTNNLTLNPNGNKIQGSTGIFIVSDEGSALQFIYVDATRGWVLTDASKASDIAEAAVFTTATGGTITTCGDYKIHTFTSPGTFCVSSIGNGPTNPLGGPQTVSYLVVAGGGAANGAANAVSGGGGAGGFREGRDIAPSYTASPIVAPTGITITASPYPITVGAGGAASTPGSNSIFDSITSTGGGSGGNRQGYVGGSGGGGGRYAPSPGCITYSGAAGNTPPVSPSQGQPGGDKHPFPYVNVPPHNGGGGGGAISAGTNASAPTAGPGGNGATTSISGSPTTYAGGGGGGGGPAFPSPFLAAGGTGGAGGGGCGISGGANVPGVSGTANTGGGGGGAGYGPPSATPQAGGGSAGLGGSGIVIIRYKYQ